MLDYSFSFIQFYKTALDGDMANSIVPSKHIQKVFDDPLGIQTILNDQPHSNPNRYFSHLSYKAYFDSVPFAFQLVTDPVTSVYLSAALIKLLTKVLMIYLLAALLTGKSHFFNEKVIIASFLLAPLFQEYGFNNTMGIIDISITYLFFYAFPFLFLMILIHLLRKLAIGVKKPKATWMVPAAAILAIILPLSGPVIAPSILLAAPLAFAYIVFTREYRFGFYGWRSIKDSLGTIPVSVFVIILLALIMSCYSLYLGTYNSDFVNDSIPLIKRYQILPQGIYKTFTYMNGFGYLYTILILNLTLIARYHKDSQGRKIIYTTAWIMLFIILYILLLPLGGYRLYRPLILRYDAILPVTMALFYLFISSSYFLLDHIKNPKYTRIYAATIALALMAYTITDAEIKVRNDCEKASLYTIRAAESDPVILSDSCQVLSWYVITNPAESERNAELLTRWKITERKKLYYYAPDKD